MEKQLGHQGIISDAELKEKIRNAGRYIDPLSDWGFKRLFGTEPNKDLLIELLNVILDDGDKK